MKHPDFNPLVVHDVTIDASASNVKHNEVGTINCTVTGDNGTTTSWLDEDGNILTKGCSILFDRTDFITPNEKCDEAKGYYIFDVLFDRHLHCGYWRCSYLGWEEAIVAIAPIGRSTF